MSDLTAWMLSFQFSTGTSVALNVAPSEAGAVALALRSILMSEPRLLDPAVVLESVTVLPIPQEQLSLLLRAAQGERPAAEVVQLVPKQGPTFEQKMRADLFVMCGLHGRQGGTHCQPCREAFNEGQPHTMLAFDPQGGAA